MMDVIASGGLLIGHQFRAGDNRANGVLVQKVVHHKDWFALPTHKVFR